MGSTNCAICGCRIHREGEYAKPTVKGRSHATRHHYVAERFFGRSATSKGKPPREPVFKNCPWGLKGQNEEFCYERHEELLHNPVLLPTDVKRFAELVQLKGLNESQKSASKDKIARRIELLHEVIEKGIKALLVAEKRRKVKERRSLSYTTTSPSLVREGDTGGGLLNKHPRGVR